MKRFVVLAMIGGALTQLGSASDDAALKAVDEIKDARVLLGGEQNNLMIQNAKVEMMKTILAQRIKRLSDLCEKKRQIVGEIQRSGDGISYTVTGCVDKPKTPPALQAGRK